MVYSEILHLDVDNKALVEVLNARQVRVTVDATPLEIKRLPKNKIKTVLVSHKPFIDLEEANKVFVNIGDKMQIYVASEIRQIVDNVFLISTEPRTKASYFITPMLGSTKEFLRWDQYFINTYLNRKGYIVLKYRFFNVEDYKEFEYTLTRHELFNKLIDNEHQYVMVQFKVPDIYINDVHKFIDGKYSRLSDPYKKRILQFHHYNKGGELGQILYKTDRRKKQLELELGVNLSEDLELYDRPDLDLEYYK
jgi:hypothetical protein